MTTPSSARSNGCIACIGGAVMNRKYRAGDAILAGTSNPASMHTSFGGVARNVAETLARLGLDVSLISVLGEDAPGRALRDHMVRLGVDMHATRTLPSVPTADYAAVLTDRGELHVAMAAMDAFDAITPDHLETVWPEAAAPPWTFADCNLPAPTLDALMRRSRAGTGSLAVDTVSVRRLSACLAICRVSTSCSPTWARPGRFWMAATSRRIGWLVPCGAGVRTLSS